jgi:hypothetical protein
VGLVELVAAAHSQNDLTKKTTHIGSGLLIDRYSDTRIKKQRPDGQPRQERRLLEHHLGQATLSSKSAQVKQGPRDIAVHSGRVGR